MNLPHQTTSRSLSTNSILNRLKQSLLKEENNKQIELSNSLVGTYQLIVKKQKAIPSVSLSKLILFQSKRDEYSRKELVINNNLSIVLLSKNELKRGIRFMKRDLVKYEI